MMWSLLFIILLVRFGLLSGSVEIAASSVGHMISLSFYLFLIFIHFPFLRAGQVWRCSRQTIIFGMYSLHFLQNLNLISKYCLGTYVNLPAQYTTIIHVKMLISHDNMKYFLPILLKQ